MGRAMSVGRAKPERPGRALLAPPGIGPARRRGRGDGIAAGAGAVGDGKRRRAGRQRARGAERRHRRDPARHPRGGPLPPARGPVPSRRAGLDCGAGSPGARGAGRQPPACARRRLPAVREPLSALVGHAPRGPLFGLTGVRWHEGAGLAGDPRGDHGAGTAVDRSQHHGPGRQRQPVEHFPGSPGHQDRLPDGRERRRCASAAHPRHPRRVRSARSPGGMPVDLGCLAAGRQFLLLRAPAAALRARGVGPQQPSHLPPSARLPAVGRPHGLALPAPSQCHDDPAPVLRHQPTDGVGCVGHRREARLLGRPARRCEAAEHDGADRARLVLALPQQPCDPLCRDRSQRPARAHRPRHPGRPAPRRLADHRARAATA